MKYLECNLNNTVKNLIVQCIAEGIGDDVKGCLKRERINDKRSTSKGRLKWDFVNRNFIEKFSIGNIVAKYAKRGSWYLVPLFDKDTGTFFTVMREDRFLEIQRQKPKRRKKHYMDALVESFNIDLEQNRQICLFEQEKSDEAEIALILENLLKEFQEENIVIRRYATILFQEYNMELVSIRCCVLDSSLQIVDQEDWSDLIHHSESIIVDTVDSKLKNREMPKIKLKDKARKKIGQRDLAKVKDDVIDFAIQEL